MCAYVRVWVRKPTCMFSMCRCVPSQALSKSLVAYYQKYVDEQSKQEIKDILVQFDRFAQK